MTLLAWRMNVYFFYELTALEMTKISGQTLKLISKNHYGWIIYYITTNELAECSEPLPDNSVPVLLSVLQWEK